jgi:hypothetical protein
VNLEFESKSSKYNEFSLGSENCLLLKNASDQVDPNDFQELAVEMHDNSTDVRVSYKQLTCYVEDCLVTCVARIEGDVVALTSVDELKLRKLCPIISSQ